LKGERDGNKEV